MLLGLIGLILIVVMLVLKIRGAILIGIVATTIIGIPMGIVDLAQIGVTSNFASAFSDLGTTFLAIFKSDGMPSLFADAGKDTSCINDDFRIQLIRYL